MIQRRFIFDVQALMALLTHYTDGRVPKDAQVVGVGSSQFFEHWTGIKVESSQWGAAPRVPGTDDLLPLHIRYEGGKVVLFDEKGKPVEHRASPEAPKRT